MPPPDHADTSAISTHSLTRRLTVYQRTSVRTVLYFNSQPHKEADRGTLGSTGSMGHFNSQPHKEADLINGKGLNVTDISTHSLTRRLTVLAVNMIHLHSIFQLTASQGG